MVSRTRLAIPTLVAITSAAACTTSTTLPAPHISAIEHPTFARYIGDDADRVIEVVGEHFDAGVTADAGSPGDSETDGIFFEIQHENGTSLPIALVHGTLLGPDRWIGTIPPEADDLLEPGLYDVTVHNSDGGDYTIEAGILMGYRATRLVLFSTTNTEPALGDANRLTALFKLETDTPGEPGYRKESILPIIETTSGTGAFAEFIQPADDISPGTYAQPTFTVIDSASEAVTITATGIPSDMVAVPYAWGTTFVAGTPFVVRIVPTAEINIADNFAITTLQIEDEWGNVCKNHLEYTADFSVSICGGATVDPDVATIPANEGSVPITVNCATTNDAFVDWMEVTATAYPHGGVTVITFD